MGDIVNLRRARKRQDRRRDDAKAAENRIVYGMTKAERRSIEAEREKADRDLDARRIVGPDDR
ncbi:MAG: DUF4169 family protein [Hyphomicrobiales bacterium]|nr:DUF4169 family protein [Hyphomicrobiales bacterium]MBV8442333.1 DUF4169 family protein [Hyphomicrobiales bacterium]